MTDGENTELQTLKHYLESTKNEHASILEETTGNLKLEASQQKNASEKELKT